MTNLYTSDLHFGHRNIVDYDGRPFRNVEEMDAELIARWNAKVRPGDQVYIVGDVGLAKTDHIVECVRQLRGNLHLIEGNHDKAALKKEAFVRLFLSLHQIKSVVDGDLRIVMCHYPLRSWNNKTHGAVHFYGHVHNVAGPNPFIYNDGSVNVGCMHWNYEPVTLAEIQKQYMKACRRIGTECNEWFGRKFSK